MPQFGLTTVRFGEGEALAVLSAGRVLPLSRAASAAGLPASSVPATMRAALTEWGRWCDLAAAAAAEPGRDGWADADSVEFCPAITDPPNVYCAGANYHDHVREMGAAAPDAGRGQPFHFLASTASLNGHGRPVTRPAGCTQFDWEVELALVIGRRAEHVPAEAAMSVIAGYTVANDLSLRDLARRDDTPFYPDWISSKCYAGCLPLGPAIVPASQVADPMNLSLSLTVNGETRQSSSTSEMIYSIARQIEFLSHVMPLLPGDVIATGTPAGTAAKWGRYLQPGNAVVAEIEQVGRLATRVVAP
jgi:2-keto-4-pentenoate hydratase/2-oxohepta-3-ene-1,7-dioic acid hydratase in catechol pathway